MHINQHFIIQKKDFKEKIDSKNIADPIIVHPEIRKNLLHMKSLNEGIRALTLWVGTQFDIIKSNNEIRMKK